MDAIRDQNFVPVKLAVLNTDPTVFVSVKVNPANNGIMVNSTDTVQFVMTPISPEDENFVNVLLFQGSDGLVYPWVANADGEVLIDN